MAQIIKEYRSLEQYQQTVHFNPDALKPDQCDHCGCEHLWCNGQLLHLTLFVRINPMLNAYYHALCQLQHVA